MIQLQFPSPATPDWAKWIQKCEEATNELVAAALAGQPFRVDPRIYGGQRNQFLESTFGKCAYCEAKISVDQDGNIEHYRPKGGVTDLDNKPIVIPDGAGGYRPHPGYFWLAYDRFNLLISCIICNQVRRRPQLRGKGNRFPVLPANAITPGDERNETPLLVNPYFDDPDDHFRFERFGVIVPLSDRGRATVGVLDLNRDALVQERRDTYQQVFASCSDFLIKQINNSPYQAEMRELLAAYSTGLKAFSAVGRGAIAYFKSLVHVANAALP